MKGCRNEVVSQDGGERARRNCNSSHTRESYQLTMLVAKTYHDIPNTAGERPIRIFIIAPVVPGYPQAKFPGKYFLPIRAS
jgi:hypothetical protein